MSPALSEEAQSRISRELEALVRRYHAAGIAPAALKAELRSQVEALNERAPDTSPEGLEKLLREARRLHDAGDEAAHRDAAAAWLEAAHQARVGCVLRFDCFLVPKQMLLDAFRIMWRPGSDLSAAQLCFAGPTDGHVSRRDVKEFFLELDDRFQVVKPGYKLQVLFPERFDQAGRPIPLQKAR
ncbi:MULTISPECIES: hypothetical protein [unclassified Variovorax]|uniref:hypothetical protein n=1 Tax=unclassified Variovorax TaxID=663243 RepID=UPI0011AEFCFD|nr:MULTISPECIES: hypothetical protein [unclassified Variovorax]